MSVHQGYICHLKAHFLEFSETIPTTFNVGASGFHLSCQMRAWALVGVRLCIFLQVGLFIKSVLFQEGLLALWSGPAPKFDWVSYMVFCGWVRGVGVLPLRDMVVVSTVADRVEQAVSTWCNNLGIWASQKPCGGSLPHLSRLQDPRILGYLLIFGSYYFKPTIERCLLLESTVH